MTKVECILCQSTSLTTIHPANDPRYYHLCENCNLIFADPSFFPDQESERKRYQYHENSIEDLNYVAFLNRAIVPTEKYLKKNMIGLDYGCGPVPTLSLLLESLGFKCYNYDPVFEFIHPLQTYDFIFSTEAFEHFHKPGKEFENIISLVKKGGLLTVMTERWKSIDQFKSWYYKNDPTHVCFYHDKTFHFLKKKFNLDILYDDGARVYVIRKIDY